MLTPSLPALLCLRLSPAPQVVGAKSKNLAGLRGKLPDWIGLPSSITVRLWADSGWGSASSSG